MPLVTPPEVITPSHRATRTGPSDEIAPDLLPSISDVAASRRVG
jgi:hypothetical protein